MITRQRLIGSALTSGEGILFGKFLIRAEASAEEIAMKDNGKPRFV